MTSDQFAAVLRILVAEAEDAGLEPEAIMAEPANSTKLTDYRLGN